MNELCYVQYSSTVGRDEVVRFDFGWWTGSSVTSGKATGCLWEGCLQKRRPTAPSFIRHLGYSTYTHFMIADLTAINLSRPQCCLFTKNQIETHLNEINKVLTKPIKWTLSYKEIADIPTWVLKLKIPNIYTNKQHLYILTRVRCLYELPFALYLKDAFKLLEEKPFKGGLEEAYTEVISRAPHPSVGLGFLGISFGSPFFGGRSICPDQSRKFTTIEDQKKRFDHLGKSSYSHVNDMYPFYSVQDEGRPRSGIPHRPEMYDLDWWIRGYEFRRPYYLELPEKSTKETYCRLEDDISYREKVQRKREAEQKFNEWRKKKRS